MDDALVHSMLMTMVVAIAAGVLVIALARRLGLPAIVLLLGAGVGLGPHGAGVLAPDSLGEGLRVVVGLGIGLILFEGGLTLDYDGYRATSKMIRRLLTVGVLVTWGLTTAAVHLIFGLPLNYAVLSGSLVIVTGPTVIAPLLKRIKVTERLHTILHWEGVLIDPIGVFLALLSFELMGPTAGADILRDFVFRFASGIAVGLVGGWVLYLLIKRRIVPEEMVNSFTLGFALLIFGGSEALITESGLLAVMVAGFVVGVKRPTQLRKLREFKAELTDLSIGTLFLLLAARLGVEQFVEFGWEGALLVAFVMLAVRPAAVVLSATGQKLSWREKGFLSWVAPRGIVAASMASLFALSLEQSGAVDNPRFVETFTYSVITATIVLQGLSASWVAKLLGVRREEPRGWLVVGAHAFGRSVGRFFRDEAGVPVVFVDTNPRDIRDAAEEGFVGLREDPSDLELYERRDALQSVGNVLALTDNEALNVLLCQRWSRIFGANHVFRWEAATWRNGTNEDAPGVVVWDTLPRPSLISAEIVSGGAHVEVTKSKHWTGSALALAGHQNARLLPELDEPPASDDEEHDSDDGHALLVLRREADYLVRSLHPELVVRLRSTDHDDALEQLVDAVVRLAPQVPRDTTLANLREREVAFSTALGNGVAAPHAYCRALDRRLCAVGLADEGVDFTAPDSEPVRLVFLVLSPSGDPEGHLATLADIARLVHPEGRRERLLGAATPADFIQIVRDCHCSG